MFVLYNILFRVFSPFLRLYFYIRCLYGKDRIESVKNHFGIATIKRPEGKFIWIHAASIGESTAALTFINHIKKKFPDLSILITTITVTSAEILYPKISKISNCYHQFVVADNPNWISKFLDYWNPKTAVFLESEIWPNTINALYDRKIPIYLLNARLSPKSFKRWKLFKGSFSKILRKFDCILAQSELDGERYRFFSNNNVQCIDNLKYANTVLPCNEVLLKTFEKLCVNKKVFVAASTHEKEEDIILEAHKKLRKKFDLITIIIPRHLKRVDRVCEIIRKHEFSFSLRSAMDHGSNILDHDSKNISEIYCVDTFGEVGTFFRLADVCFVGGSLVQIGGHNIYEPAALKKPVLHGPFMDNALEIRDFLHSNNIAFEVKNSDDIYNIFCKLAEDKNLMNSVIKTASKFTKNESLEKIDKVMQLERLF